MTNIFAYMEHNPLNVAWPCLDLSHNCGVACFSKQRQQNKTVITVKSGIFGVLSRDWSRVEITFCAGYHKPV